MTYIIAEAGVNHNGSVDLAKKLALVAKQSGADAVKYQTFKAENLVTKNAAQAEYQVQNLGETTSQYDMLKKLELSFDEFVSVKQYCDEIGIEFLSTPFDLESVDFLINDLKISKVKIPSGELTNLPFVHEIALKQKPMIVSTGMATIDEIHETLAYIAYGLAGRKEINPSSVKLFYSSNEAKTLIHHFVTVLHCTTEYPAPFNELNLKAIEQFKEIFNIKVGFSDHSEGIAAPIAAVALGAEVIEKHFTLDKSMEGPDHVASLNPLQLQEMVKHIREIEQSLGSGYKQPSKVELSNRKVARKSIVAKTTISKGDVFTKDSLIIKRPGTGMSPAHYWSLLGKAASKEYQKDELIDE